jgi:4-amino-4-deoxy-L-arabinose transferase-like glycosyltransferase
MTRTYLLALLLLVVVALISTFAVWLVGDVQHAWIAGLLVIAALVLSWLLWRILAKPAQLSKRVAALAASFPMIFGVAIGCLGLFFKQDMGAILVVALVIACGYLWVIRYFVKQASQPE